MLTRHVLVFDYGSVGTADELSQLRPWFIQPSERSCSLYLIQRQIGGSHNAYFKQEISLYLLFKEIQLFVCFVEHFLVELVM